ncbi:hypothetical protein Q8F55_005146 [Vanrija albida]|uniref:Uncharacterized protein n=1 Tax=Vanrija albida TaxID=181172 RepID=A0ABR3Q0T6_9TREE
MTDEMIEVIPMMMMVILIAAPFWIAGRIITWPVRAPYNAIEKRIEKRRRKKREKMRAASHAENARRGGWHNHNGPIP